MFLIWMFYPKTRGAIIVFDILVNKLINVGLVEKKKQNWIIFKISMQTPE